MLIQHNYQGSAIGISLLVQMCREISSFVLSSFQIRFLFGLNPNLSESLRIWSNLAAFMSRAPKYIASNLVTLQFSAYIETGYTTEVSMLALMTVQGFDYH